MLPIGNCLLHALNLHATEQPNLTTGMYFKEVSSICHGTQLQFFEDRPIQTLLIDSRKAVINKGSIFIAIKGERHDGHLFLKELFDLGMRQFIVEQEIDKTQFQGANILRVNSSLKALQSIAAHHRALYSLPVVGITGSNGKTIIKEWLYQVLSPQLKIVKNPGSYNSQVGVPLSVWQINEHHQLGIFEAGISRLGEMELLQQIIRPTIGIFTNLGSAHDEGFASHKEKADEKIKLFSGCEKVIYCRDHLLIHESLLAKGISGLSWGYHDGATIKIKAIDASIFQVHFRTDTFTLELPFKDAASKENAFHVMAFMLYRGYKPSVIAERLRILLSVPMRLELKQGLNRCTIIDDTYNNDLAGLRISLDFLKNQLKAKKSLILSDILQSGLSGDELTKEISGLIASSGIKKLVGIGPSLSAHRHLFPDGIFSSSTSDFLQKLHPDDFADEIILIKGARLFEFEKIVQRLQRKVHGTVMEIDMNAMIHNLNYFKSILQPGTKIMAMVKAFAYGSGSEEVANLLQYHRVDYLGVAYADEGIELRKNNISLPIMVMNPSEESFTSLLEYNLEPEVYSLRILKALITFLEDRPCKIHIKMDTGMHRLGFDASEIEEATRLIHSSKNLRVASVFSHLAGADEMIHDDFSKQQGETFIRMAEGVEKVLDYRPLRHLLNSPGILRLPQYQFDMVRLGIGLYGVDPTEVSTARLKPVASLKTMISQIKMIKGGETIGYGRKGKAENNMMLATIAIGYADGFSRRFSQGKGKVLIHGEFAPVMGNVCMDMTMVDITDIAAKEGDEVTIFGPDLPIQQVAKWIDTIPYELLTSTSERVKRVFFAESI